MGKTGPEQIHAAAKHRNLMLIFVAAFFVYLNFYTSLTLLPLYLVELGGNEFLAGLQTTLFYVAAILFRFYTGPLADQKGRRLPLIIGAVAFCTAPLLFLASSDIWMLTLARIYQAIGIAAFFSSGSSLVADLAPPARVGSYIGAYRLVINISLLSGPPLALFVTSAYSFRAWFVLSVLTGLAALAGVVLINDRGAAPTGGDKPGSGYRILKDKAVWRVFWGIILTSVCYAALLTFAVLYISGTIQVVNPGFYFTAFSLAGILANLGAGYLSDRLGRPAVVWPSIILSGIGAGLLYYLPGLPAIWIVSGVMSGVGFSGSITVLIAWLVEIAGKTARGTALALQESAIDLSFSVGSFVFGLITVRAGMGLTFLITGLAVAIASSILLLGDLKRTGKPIK